MNRAVSTFFSCKPAQKAGLAGAYRSTWNRLAAFIKVACLLVLFLAGSLNAGAGVVANKVSEFENNGVVFQNIDLLKRQLIKDGAQLSLVLSKYTLVDINVPVKDQVLNERPEFIRVQVPKAGVMVSLMLYRSEISPSGFTLLTPAGTFNGALNRLVHYRGCIENDPHSVASLTVSENEVMGIISDDSGNLVIAKMDGSQMHVIYNDRDLNKDFNYGCESNTEGVSKPVNPDWLRIPPSGTILAQKCVNMYYETDYDVFIDKGSVSAVNTYVQGIFNNVATLYNNDGVMIYLQTLFVWDVVDPYTGPSTTNFLSQFGQFRTSYAGNMATLIGYSGSGGVAFVNTICSSNASNRMAYTGINRSYLNVPTYSWTVEVITHENGHVIASKHTHDCAWNGNNTRIDGCGPQAGYSGSGTCSAGPIPSSGTIMSYCHLVSGVGIDFNNGFGSQPAALLVNTINNAACLSQCSSCAVPSQPGVISGLSSYCGSASLTYSVAPVSGATSYVWSLPAGWSGTSTTNVITVNPGSTGGTISVMAENACGRSTTSVLNVTGNALPSVPTNLSGNVLVCTASSQQYTANAVSGATSYVWTTPLGWTGSSTSTVLSVVAGLTGGSISVAAKNGCGTGPALSLPINVITSVPAQPGIIVGPVMVCTGSNVSYDIAPVAGAASYNWTLPTGWSGISSVDSIQVLSGSTNGIVSVSAVNVCGAGPATNLTVNSNQIPASVDSVNLTGGNNLVCSGDSRTLTASMVNGATSYNWTTPAGITIVSGQGTPVVVVTFNTAFTSADSISVQAVNNCGGSSLLWTIFDLNLPPAPSSIMGPSSGLCGLSSVSYSVNPDPGVTYTWTFSGLGATVISGQGTSSILASFASNAPANSLSVAAQNSCGSGAPITLSLFTAPSLPGPISGTTTPCANQQNVPYSIAPVATATSYKWTVPSGSRIRAGSVTSRSTSLTTTYYNIGVNFKTTAGNVSVSATNGCGSSAFRTLPVTFPCRLAGDPEVFTLKVFPSIVSDYLNLIVKSNPEQSSTLIIRDITGKTILSKGVFGDATDETISLDVANWTPGIYSVQYYQDDRVLSARFLKQ